MTSFRAKNKGYCRTGNLCNHNLCLLVFFCNIILWKCNFAFLAASLQTISWTKKYFGAQFLQLAKNSQKRKTKRTANILCYSIQFFSTLRSHSSQPLAPTTRILPYLSSAQQDLTNKSQLNRNPIIAVLAPKSDCRNTVELSCEWIAPPNIVEILFTTATKKTAKDLNGSVVVKNLCKELFRPQKFRLLSFSCRYSSINTRWSVRGSVREQECAGVSADRRGSVGENRQENDTNQNGFHEAFWRYRIYFSP